MTQPVIPATATKNLDLKTNTDIFQLTRETVQQAHAQIYKTKIHNHDKNHITVIGRSAQVTKNQRLI